MTERTRSTGRPRYRVLAGLSYPTDPAVIRRLQSGENVAWNERHLTAVEPGAIVDDIPAVSLAWLLEQRLIEPVEEGA